MISLTGTQICQWDGQYSTAYRVRARKFTARIA
jgi:hypothetical protein